ncbi:uncharacterized protein LOC132800143 [Ziziphus jujuba]|uniref:Uncharacterized protein LOC132800143 n=1 Tax=Ziziphus jujuba TaxID=326968 RepID=A0ABM3ZXE3_ZIZJJ|nr:uncharacterized protein LOC132800143 [Ziziphus jujuba]
MGLRKQPRTFLGESTQGQVFFSLFFHALKKKKLSLLTMERRNQNLDNPNCPFGCECIETEVHLFFHCHLARALWLASPWSVKWEDIHPASLKYYLESLMDPTGILPVHPSDWNEFFLFAALIFETIWRIRNRFIFDNSMCSLEDEVRALFTRFEEHKLLGTVHHQLNNPKLVADSVWCPPPVGVVKINCDAAVKNGSANIGIVVRNHLGRVLKVKVFKENITIPEAADALAILKAMKLAIVEGHLNLCCESDAKAVIQSLNTTDSSSSH